MKVYTVAFNNPSLITYQKKLLDKFFPPHEFTVVCNAKSEAFHQLILEQAEQNNIPFIESSCSREDIPGSDHHGKCLTWLYSQYIKNTDDLVVILDHDMFPVKFVDPYVIIEHYSIVGYMDHRGDVKYFWPGLLFIRPSTIVESLNFEPSYAHGNRLDTGGGTYSYVERYPDRLKDFNVELVCSCDYIPGYGFWHLGRGSNWNNDPEFEFNVRMEQSKQILQQLIDS